MESPLLALQLQKRRDVVLARGRARQLGRLLGLDPREQALLAAAVFEVAVNALKHSSRVRLQFLLEDDRLRIHATGCRRRGPWHLRRPPGHEDAVCLEKRLPARPESLAGEDVAWAMRELEQLTPDDLFEEVRQQNQEVLWLLHQLQASQPAGGKPAAA